MVCRIATLLALLFFMQHAFAETKIPAKAFMLANFALSGTYQEFHNRCKNDCMRQTAEGRLEGQRIYIYNENVHMKARVGNYRCMAANCRFPNLYSAMIRFSQAQFKQVVQQAESEQAILPITVRFYEDAGRKTDQLGCKVIAVGRMKYRFQCYRIENFHSLLLNFAISLPN